MLNDSLNKLGNIPEMVVDPVIDTIYEGHAQVKVPADFFSALWYYSDIAHSSKNKVWEKWLEILDTFYNQEDLAKAKSLIKILEKKTGPDKELKAGLMTLKYVVENTENFDTSYTYKIDVREVESQKKEGTKNFLELNGGKGSGNFGHEGRPGVVGGSGSGSSKGNSESSSKKTKKSSSGKSAKDWYKEKYPDDYQSEDIPDKPISELTDKDTEHLDTQVRERLAKEKRATSTTNKDITKRAEERMKEASESADIAKEWSEAFDKFDYDTEGLDKLNDDLSEAEQSVDFILRRYADHPDGSDVTKEALRDTADDLMRVSTQAYEYKMKATSDYAEKLAADIENLAENLEKKDNSLLGYDKLGRPVYNGGKGSGNFGHSGRPGVVGGSAGDGASHKSHSSKASVSKKELTKDSTKSIESMHKGVSRSIEETKEEISSLKKGIEEGRLKGNWKENAEERIKKLEDQLETEEADKAVYEEVLKERKSSKSASKSTSDKKSSAKFKSRYADKETFEYDGETFYVDSETGGTSKDGKRSVMFPDQLLHEREKLIKVYEDGKVSPSRDQLSSLADKLADSTLSLSDKKDIKKATDLLNKVEKLIEEKDKKSKK